MTVGHDVGDGTSRAGRAVAAGRARLDGMVAGLRVRADEMRDERERRALIVDLGELYYAHQTGAESPQLEADLDAVVAELQRLESIAEIRRQGAGAPVVPPAGIVADTPAPGRSPVHLSSVGASRSS